MDDRSEWLQSLKKGDEVCVSGRAGHVNHVETVERVTKTLILTRHGRYRKSDGHTPGRSYYGSAIYPVTDQIRQDDFCRRARSTINKKLRDASTWSVDKYKAVLHAMNLPDDYTGEASDDAN